jgi:hypothetical protein
MTLLNTERTREIVLDDVLLKYSWTFAVLEEAAL